MLDPGTILVEPKKRRFTREEYYKMVEMGLFDGQRVELIDGEVIQMAPQMNRHAVTIGLIDRALRRLLGDDYWVRLQAPINVNDSSEPEPDVAIVPGSPRDYGDHPKTALLVVEVSESTYRFDSKIKASLYASAGIEDYWILNLNSNRLEVYREPVADDAQPFGHRYASAKMLAATEIATCLAFPQVKLTVADLLP
ncbi:MAG TPA: Uma2 family endonuclease [Tepidisphaeraceae bacterium]|nr:Uma2 family endonuclease [Tepidisphaeraceae bacterium]